MELPKIICPKCGQEYIPAEIYLPDAFFGKPTDIIRNDAGKVMFALGPESDTTEQYVCDKCFTRFSVDAHVSFETHEVVKNTKSSYVTPLAKKNRGTLCDLIAATSEQ